MKVINWFITILIFIGLNIMYPIAMILGIGMTKWAYYLMRFLQVIFLMVGIVLAKEFYDWFKSKLI